MTAEQIAPIIHEAIRGLQRYLGQEVAPPWEEATWQKQSTIDAVTFALENPYPGAAHDRWMHEKIQAGWTYGPVRDNDQKLHPMLVPYEKLTRGEIAKDQLICGIVTILRRVP